MFAFSDFQTDRDYQDVSRGCYQEYISRLSRLSGSYIGIIEIIEIIEVSVRPVHGRLTTVVRAHTGIQFI